MMFFIAMMLLQTAFNCTPVITEPGGNPPLYSGTCDWSSLNLRDGTYTLTARATDAAGNVSLSPILIKISGVYISAPANDQTVSGNRVQVTANVANPAINVARIEFFVDNVLKNTVTNRRDLNVRWNSNPYKNLTPTLKVVATDSTGKKATSTIKVNVR